MTDLYDSLGDEASVGGPAVAVAATPERFPPRPYQVERIDGACDAFATARSVLLVMATGTGKTATMTHIGKRRRHLGPVLFVVHKDDLVQQAAKAFRESMPGIRLEIEKAEEYATLAADVVVASNMSMWKERRLQRFPRDHFKTLFIDECHRCTRKNKTYANIVDWFTGAKILGATATPDRKDELAMGEMFEVALPAYDILDGIGDGFLVPVVQQLEVIEGYDISGLALAGEDFDETELDKIMRQEKVLHGVAAAAVKYSNMVNVWGAERPTLIFASSVAHSKLLADILNRRHARDGSGTAASIDCKTFKTHEVRSILDRFREGQFRYLVNFDMVGEGTDLPECRVVVQARPTGSRKVYAQQIGRVTRPTKAIVQALNEASSAAERHMIIKASDKPTGLAVDIVGNSGRHKLVIQLTDMLGGKYSDEVVDAARRAIAKKGGRGNVSEELREAAKRHEAEQLAKRRNFIVDVELSSRPVDPFDVLDLSTAREPGWHKGRLPSDAQKAALERNGIERRRVEGMTFWEATQTLDAIYERRKKGLCTVKQAMMLRKFGENDSGVTFEQATKILDEIARNGWRPRTSGLNNAPNGGALPVSG